MFMRTGVLATAWHLLGPAPAAAAQTPAILDSIDRYVRTEVARYPNVEHHVPATDSTIYQSGSVGKQFPPRTHSSPCSTERTGRAAGFDFYSY